MVEATRTKIHFFRINVVSEKRNYIAHSLPGISFYCYTTLYALLVGNLVIYLSFWNGFLLERSTNYTHPGKSANMKTSLPFWLCTMSMIGISSTSSDTVVQPIVALVGDDVILPCTLRHTVSAVHQSVEWQRPDLKPKEVHLYRDEKDDLVLQNPVFRGRTSLFKEELENGNTSLKLTRVKLSDAGNYTCYIPLLDNQKTIIQLLVGESTHLLTTQTPLGDRSHEIKGAVSRPVIIIERMEGDEVVLRCEAEGCYPEPVMEWCDAQGRVLPAAGPTETSRDRKGCYTVTSHVIVPNSDNNTFTCRVQQLEIKHMKERQVHVPDQMFPKTCHSCWLTVLVAVPVVYLAGVGAGAGGLYLLIKKGILTIKKRGRQ